MSDQNSKTRWHLLLGTLLEYLLPPVGIQVQLEPQVMSNPPQADILLLRRDTEYWTEPQKALLADGIRDTPASHILLEFKYTESISYDAIQQLLGYEYFYRQAQKLDIEQLNSFLLSAKTPQAATLEKLDYHTTTQAGIYRSNNWLLQKITIISLNDLPPTSHNAWLKCFASKLREKKKALQQIETTKLKQTNNKLNWFINGLINFFFQHLGTDPMKTEITPEELLEFGKILDEIGWRELHVEKRLEGLSAEQRLQGLDPEQRLQGLDPEQRLRGLDPDSVLKQYNPEQRLQGLTPEEIEAYLEKLKRNKH